MKIESMMFRTNFSSTEALESAMRRLLPSPPLSESSQLQRAMESIQWTWWQGLLTVLFWSGFNPVSGRSQTGIILCSFLFARNPCGKENGDKKKTNYAIPNYEMFGKASMNVLGGTLTGWKAPLRFKCGHPHLCARPCPNMQSRAPSYRSRTTKLASLHPHLPRTLNIVELYSPCQTTIRVYPKNTKSQMSR